MFLEYCTFIILGFISGSIMYSYLIPKYMCGINIIKKSSDGNPGTTNAVKLAGRKIGFLCLILDLLKAFLPVFIATYFLDVNNIGFAFVLASPIFGHGFSPFLYFNGGKAIASSIGSMLGIICFSKAAFILLGIYIVFASIIRINPHSNRAIVTYIIFLVTMIFICSSLGILFGCFLITSIIVFKHIREISKTIITINFVGIIKK